MPDTRLALALALAVAVLPACGDASPEPAPEVGKTTHELNYDVEWINDVNVDPDGNSLEKDDGSGMAWDAGAVSVQTLGRRGFIRFTTGETDTAKYIGLSSVNDGDLDQSYEDIDYALKFGSQAEVTIWDHGAPVNTGMLTWSYTAGEQFFIETTPTEIIFKKGSPPSTEMWTLDVSADDFPLQVDTSLRSFGATLNNVVIHPTIHVAVQGDFFAGDLNCAVNDAVSIHGDAFLQYGVNENYDTYLEFEDTDPTDVAERLDMYAVENLGIADTETFTGIIIMDIESPHPKDLWTYGSIVQSRIIEGYKRRIVGARMAFPNAQLGLYGTLVPDADGDDMNGSPDTDDNERDDVLDRFDALYDAATQELFDDLPWNEEWEAPRPPVCETDNLCPGLDYLVPVLYIRFGCDGTTCEPDFDAIAAYTDMGIELSRDLDGDLPVLPLLTVRVKNNSSDYDEDLLLDLNMADPLGDTLSLQMERFAAAVPPVTDVVLWLHGVKDGQQLLGEVNVGPDDVEDACQNAGDCWTVDDYTCSM